MPLAGGGVAIHDLSTGTLSIVDGDGVLRSTSPLPLADAQQVLTLGEWVGTAGTGTLAAITAPAVIQPGGASLLGSPLIVQESMFSYFEGRGNAQRQSAPPAGFTEREPAALEGLRRGHLR